MKYLTQVLLLISGFFFINILFYYLNDDYKFFLKKIKNSEEVVYIDKKELIDNINDEDEFRSASTIIRKIKEEKSDDIEKDGKLNDDFYVTKSDDIEKDGKLIDDFYVTKSDDIEKEKNILKETEIVLGKQYRDILDLFSKYDLGEIKIKQDIFDITDEFPDDYLEYYSTDLTLYIFLKKDYSEIKDIFDVISYESAYEINELNNFGDNSFFINLNEKIQDNFVRLVIGYKSVVFGLKIKKDQYNNVKQKLESLKK